MKGAKSRTKGFTLIEMLATCALAALAMALGAMMLSGAGDPLPRAEQTFLEAHGMARLTALTNGPAMMVRRGTRLDVLDGHGTLAVSRSWPESVAIKGMPDGLHIDRLGRSLDHEVEFVSDGRSIAITIQGATGIAKRVEGTP